MEKVITLLGFLFVLTGCEGERSINFIEPGPIVSVCDERKLNEDVSNCGECGNVCPASDSDSCIEGVCGCGTGAICDDVSDCRFGKCIPTDPEGDRCEFDDECHSGYSCIEGNCTFVSCDVEDCDGIDNDCDGKIDEIDGRPLSEWCYSGSLDRVGPPCKAGVRYCINGEWSECIGEVSPVSELGLLSCDEIDNDCDGCTDGDMIDGVCVYSNTSLFDIVYVIDTSGSMQTSIEATKTATQSFSSLYAGDTNFQFGIIVLPSSNASADAYLYLDLSNFSVFQASLAALGEDTGGIEPQYDTIYDLGTEAMPVSWREGSVRIIILFTDELGQSVRTPRITETDMCDSLVHGEVFVVFTNSYLYPDFDDCSTIFELNSTDSNAMAADLLTVIRNPCE